jgi:quercetin dioxygenase-like cupin family protein
MRIYRQGTGEKYTPFDHFNMQTQVVFNPDTGCKKANITLSRFQKGSGSNDEVHEKSDQIFYMLQGRLKFSAQGRVFAELEKGDALLVLAGEVHSVRNDEEEDGVLLAITVPPLDQTH